jgi:predicted benzoate:H+ symporter BenE
MAEHQVMSCGTGITAINATSCRNSTYYSEKERKYVAVFLVGIFFFTTLGRSIGKSLCF